MQAGLLANYAVMSLGRVIAVNMYTKTDLVLGFLKNQILVAVILAQFYLGFYPKTILR